MPPFVARKRRQSTLPPDAPTPKRAKKPTLFDTQDAPTAQASVQDTKKFLDNLNGSDSDISLSDADSSDFEDVLPDSTAKRRRLTQEDEEDDDIQWEDAVQDETSAPITPAVLPSGDLELTLNKTQRFGNFASPVDRKKGPSKIERQIRIATHCMHVQFLLFHNAIRNAWICDKELQGILVGQLPEQIKKEVETWKRASGIATEVVPYNPRSRRGGPDRGRGRGRSRGERGSNNSRNQRDWGQPAERQEVGAPNLSRGDPVIRLLKYLAAYWKKRFRVTAPGLRKQGYKSLATLEKEIASFHNDKHDPEIHGEKIRGIRGFRECARKGEGSRDVGAQLFTVLIRGLGIEARLVASLQPVGFGWSKNEEANRKRGKSKNGSQKVDDDPDDDREEEPEPAKASSSKHITPVSKSRTASKSNKTVTRAVRQQANGTKGQKDTPIKISDESELSSLPQSPDMSDGDDESVIDVTPSAPKWQANMNYDADLQFPNYWTEVISPLTHEVIPVDSMILIPPVATNQEKLAAFEPRGGRADKIKQVFAYVIAYSSDGTAKEVTTRYLKRHMWPGKTKGFRLSVERVAVLNKRGKVKYYEEYDWFKNVMSGYMRTDKMRRAVDDIEESKDLKAIKPEKKVLKDAENTLQGYKQSADYVLERHLRREEALLPAAIPVKTFVVGKGDKAIEEPVYRRKDVVICRTGESWHKEGREIKAGEQPMKMVPVRAVTLTRKREVEEAERDTGEKLKQGMYAWDQTDWIIPEPIKDGVIPKNAFGNIDCFVPTMVPEGAVHIPLRGTVRVCKRLGVDYAEAVTGFEFGNRMAVPVITGVVVAEKYRDKVLDQWEKDEIERKIKEEGKREKMALAMWRKFLMGLRIVERVQGVYGKENGHLGEESNPFTNKNRNARRIDVADNLEPAADDGGETMAGGFITEGADEVDEAEFRTKMDTEDDMGGGFMINDEPRFPEAEPMFESAQSTEADDCDSVTDEDDKMDREEPAELKKASNESKSRPEAEATGKRKMKNKSTSQQSRKAAPKSDAAMKSKKVKYENRDPESGTAIFDLTNLPRKTIKGHMSQAAVVTRAIPRRQAAQKSEIALKSRYFEHDSDSVEDDLSSEDLESEAESIVALMSRTAKGKGKAGAAAKSLEVGTSKARRGRPRKSP